MDLEAKLQILAGAARYDVSCSSSGSRRGNAGGLGSTVGCGVCHSFTPDGRCISLLKLLLTNYCIFDCKYCANRVSADLPRARFSVAEVVYLTTAFYRRNYIEGLFLSSGIIRSPDHTMEQMLEVVRQLRETQRFFGYIHMKAIPGASQELVAQAGRYVDRLSVNIELPTESDLRALAPDKKLGTLMGTMGAIRDCREAAEADRPAPGPSTAARRGRRSGPPPFAPAGQSTQMVVGASPTPDLHILETAGSLYRTHRLKRVYYSAFSPVPKADPLLPETPPPLIREHRLYQADWLMRFYGFAAGELVSPQQPNLDLETDPKLAWALRHRGFFPIDVNAAPREALLRVPGLGVRSIGRILQARRHRKLRLADLQRLRVPMKRLRPFIITADDSSGPRVLDSVRLPGLLVRPRQLELFSAAESALSGEL